MRKIVLLEFLSLDGVLQGPGGRNEDPSGGFELSGWTAPFDNGDTFDALMTKQMGVPFDLLLGKITYGIWAAYWPKQTGELGKIFNTPTKYVVTHGEIDASWERTVVITGDVVEQIKQLKAGDGPMLQVYGSGNLAQTLLEHDLVDELWLKTYPVTLGKGKRLFGDTIRPAAWKLTESVVLPSGMIAANYVRNGDVETGDVG